MWLGKIEKRIFEIKDTLSDKSREKSMASSVPMSIFERRLVAANRPLLEELEKLEIRRRFILDKRDSLFWRVVWNVIVPMIVSVVTAFIVSSISK